MAAEPTLLKDTAQINYEVIRPVILWGVTLKERGAKTGVSRRTIYYRANLFDQAGMASLLPAEPPPPVPKLDKRSLPPVKPTHPGPPSPAPGLAKLWQPLDRFYDIMLYLLT